MPDALMLHRGINLARGYDRATVGKPARDSDWLTITVVFHLAQDWREPADRIRETVNHVAQFMRTAGEPLLYVYVQEASGKKNRHWHMILYVPKVYQEVFKARFKQWITAKADPTLVHEDAVKLEPAWRMQGAVRYLLKDGTDEVRASFGVPDTDTHKRSGGVVDGQRVGVSRQLRAAIKADDDAGNGRIVQLRPARPTLPSPLTTYRADIAA